MSAACAGSVLTLGIAASSTSSARMRSWFDCRCARTRSFTSVAAVDGEHLAGNPVRIVRREEEDSIGDVLGRTKPLQRDAIDERPLPVGAVGLPLPFGGSVGAHESRCNVVDRYAPRSQLVRELPCEADLRCFRRRIRLDASQADTEPRATRDVDDAAASRRFHSRRNGLNEVKRTGDVDVENGLPLLRRDLFERTPDLSEIAARLMAERHDDAELRVDFCGTLPHGEIAPDAAVRLG